MTKCNLDDFFKKAEDNENLGVEIKARNSKYGEDFIPLSVDYDVSRKDYTSPSWFGGLTTKTINK